MKENIKGLFYDSSHQVEAKSIPLLNKKFIAKHLILPMFFLIVFLLSNYFQLIESDKIQLTGSNEIRLFTDIVIFSYMILFFSDFSRDEKKVFLLSLFLLSTVLFLIINEYDTKLDRLLVLPHLLALILILPYFLIGIGHRYLLDIPFKWFIKINTFTMEHISSDNEKEYTYHDLFTATKKEMSHHQKDEIYLDIYSLSQDGHDEEFKEIKLHYLRLIKFWYAQKNYLSHVRYFFPFLALILGFSIFFLLREFICNDVRFTNTSPIWTIMSLFLIVFYLTITYHFNSFLSSKFYMNNILQALNKIYFDNHESKHQLKLFLDKNFLIYIHDRNYDRHLCVNTNKDFQNFISEEKFDKEGRNHILTVFISFILILFIEIIVNTKATEKDNKSPQCICVKDKKCNIV